ncbi:hypothetical protein D3C75_1315510 [compost metagenome]
MMVREAPPYIEHRAQGIQQAADNEQKQAAISQILRKAVPGEYNDPAHYNIENRRGKQKPLGEKRLKGDPGNRNSPHDAKQRPT